MNKTISKTLFSVFHKYLKNDDLYRLINLYNQTQYLSEAELHAFQQKKLFELLKYSSEQVKYYNNIISENKIDLSDRNFISNFKKIPILNKEIIRQNFTEMLSVSHPKKYWKQNSTSGSTGSNLDFYSDSSSLNENALLFRNFAWMGLDFFDKKATVWGASWDVNRAYKIIPYIKNQIKNQIILSGYQLSDYKIEEYYKIFKKSNPKLLRSYPSILYTLAQKFEESGFSYSPVAIESAGEKLHEFQRKKIESVFGKKLFDFYGARDIPMIAMECEQHNGLHVISENVYLEVVDDNNNPISEGEGDLVITHLHNRVMPFIRYKIGDRAKISNRKCRCGRSLPLIEEVIGRTFEIISFPNGNNVGGSFWTLVMRSVAGIKDFQVVQEEPDYIKIIYTSDEKNLNNELIKIKSKIMKFSGPMLKIDFIHVDSIPKTKGGKFQFVISKIK